MRTDHKSFKHSMRTFGIPAIIFCFLTACNSESRVDKNLFPSIDSFKISQCIENCKDPEKTIYKTYEDNTLELKVGKILSCLDSLPSIKLNSDTLFLSIEPPGDVDVACDCYFNIEVRIKNLSFNPKTILINGRQVGERKNG